MTTSLTNLSEVEIMGITSLDNKAALIIDNVL